MIKNDQPTIFGKDVTCAVSSVSDGQMQLGWKEPDEEVVNNRQRFLKSVGISAEESVLVKIKYQEGATYDVIKEVSATNSGEGMFIKEGEPTDCLVTTTPKLGLFVPIADCGATVVYDHVKKVLALAHLGRHSTVAELPKKLILFLQSKYGTSPSDIKVWISPSISAESYVLEYAYFAKKNSDWSQYCKKVDSGYQVDNAGFNKSQFIKYGVNSKNIQLSNIDTASSNNYWSHHKEVTVNHSSVPPRFAVVAYINN